MLKYPSPMHNISDVCRRKKGRAQFRLRHVNIEHAANECKYVSGESTKRKNIATFNLKVSSKFQVATNISIASHQNKPNKQSPSTCEKECDIGAKKAQHFYCNKYE